MWRNTDSDIHRKLPAVDSMAHLKRLNSPLTPVERVLKESLHSSTFLDVKFFAFSRRSYSEDGLVRVSKPQHVLAISSVLKKIDYFEKLLSNGFAESKGRASLDAPFPEDEALYTDGYDYESDSDLEDDEVAVQDEDVPTSPSRRAGKQREPSGNSSSRSYSDANGGRCQQIVIKDTAYHTWRAFIFYLYFNKVNFLPLKSEDGERREATMIKALDDPEAVPPCSPKSMFRLAEKYGIIELQDLAFNAIQSRLSTKNIVGEVFSRFTSRYERVREFEVRYLQEHLSEVRETLAEISDRLVQGEFPHAGDILKTLLNIKTPDREDPPGHQYTFGQNTGGNVKPPLHVQTTQAPVRPRQPFRGNFAPPLFRSTARTGTQSQAESAPVGSAWVTFEPPRYEDDDF